MAVARNRGHGPNTNASLPNEIDFYAAAVYLSDQPSQEFSKPAGRPYQDNILRADELDKEFLDTIALLCAHFKPAPNAFDDKRFLTRHVTATGMQKTEKLVIIYIAKNGGPQYFRGKKDEEFAEQLETFLNVHRKTDNPPQQPGMPFIPERWSPRPIVKPEEFEDYLYKWWGTRLDYYERQIREKWRPQERKKVKQYYQAQHDYGKSLRYFESDWKDVETLIKQSDGSKYSVRECLLNSSGTYQDIGRQDYPRVTDPQRSAAERFRKVIKSIKFLRTVQNALTTCMRFENSLKGRRVEVKFEPIIQPKRISKAGIITKLKSYANNVEDKSVKLKFATAIKTLNALNGNSIQARFHCEMQLLQKLHNQADVLDYFGCSKRSCFLCWEILKGTSFITKDAHNKLYYKWFVPFTQSQLGDAHTRLSKLLSSRFYAAIGNPSRPTNSFMSETDALDAIQREETQEDPLDEPIPDSCKKFMRYDPCEFQTLQIPMAGEPAIRAYHAFNLRTLAGLLSDFEAIVNIEVPVPDGQMIPAEGSWERDWLVSDIQLRGHNPAWRPWYVLPVPAWRAELFEPSANQSDPREAKRLYVLLRRDYNSHANEWCQSMIRNSHSTSGPGNSKGTTVWRGHLFLYFTNSAGTELKDFQKMDVDPALQAFTKDYLTSNNRIHEELEERDGQMLLRWTCPEPAST